MEARGEVGRHRFLSRRYAALSLCLLPYSLVSSVSYHRASVITEERREKRAAGPQKREERREGLSRRHHITSAEAEESRH